MVALSVLDLAVVRSGGTSSDALRDTTSLAGAAERLGFVRFWVAEHHNLVSVASTAPAVLIAHLAAHTSTIRVGSGGVMLTNHSPLSIAEQFAMLEALHPSRIDLGIGRAPGTDPVTAAALGRDPSTSVDRFPRDVIDVMGLLGDPRGDDGTWTRLSATPVATGTPMIALLGSSGYSAQLAGMLGLPFAYAHHFDTGATDIACRLYHEHFRPSARHPHPSLIVGVNAIAAETDDDAERLARPARLMRYAIRTNQRAPLVDPDQALQHPQFEAAVRMPTEMVVGCAERVAEQLHALAARTGADELMITGATFDVADRVRSLELIAGAL